MQTIKHRSGKFSKNIKQFWKDFQDLHLHFDDFKNSIEKEFAFLKEATKRNIENF